MYNRDSIESDGMLNGATMNDRSTHAASMSRINVASWPLAALPPAGPLPLIRLASRCGSRSSSLPCSVPALAVKHRVALPARAYVAAMPLFPESWSALQAADVAPLSALFEQEPERAERLSLAVAGITFDFAKTT